MSRQAVIGVDCSTTACKVAVWDTAGQCLAQGRAVFELHNPEPEAWLQNAEDWWRAFCQACTQALAGCSNELELLALGLTHQRETFVLCDDQSVPLAPAMVWMDHRCDREVEAAVAALGRSVIHRISGKPPHTTPSLYKLKFQLNADPSLTDRAAKVLDVGAFIHWRLTGRCATALASADPLGWVDMKQRAWSSQLLGWLGLNETQLPELVASGETLGETTPAASEATGLPPGLPVVAVGGDGQAAGMGAGIVTPGRAYLNLGTAIVSGVLSDEFVFDDAFRTLYAAAEHGYFLETDLHGGTFSLNWLCKNLLGRDIDYLNQLEKEACALPCGSDGLLWLPYQGGVMNPYWDATASGVFMGLRGHHRPAHLYRAMLEGIAMEQRLQSNAVAAVVGNIDEFVVLGGGSQSALWCQILADVLQKPMVRAGSHEATALGAAIVASARDATCAERAVAMTSLGDRFVPGPARERYHALYQEVYADWYPSLRQRMARLDRWTKA